MDINPQLVEDLKALCRRHESVLKSMEISPQEIENASSEVRPLMTSISVATLNFTEIPKHNPRLARDPLLATTAIIERLDKNLMTICCYYLRCFQSNHHLLSLFLKASGQINTATLIQKVIGDEKWEAMIDLFLNKDETLD